jgi:hypothetical protein
VAQAALLAAAAAAPVVGASTAEAANLPLGGLGGLTQPDLPVAGLDQVGGLAPDTSTLPLVGSEGLDGLGRVAKPLGQLEQTDLSGLTSGDLGSMTQPGVALAEPDVSNMAQPDLTGIARPHVAKLSQVAKSVHPDVSKVVDTNAPVPKAAKSVADQSTDHVGQQLEDSILGPAMMGMGPSLPVAGYAADKSINAAVPATDTALAYGTQRQVATNSATTVDGISTPLREVPRLL